MPTGPDMKRTLEEQRAKRQRDEQVRQTSIAAAVGDVLSGEMESATAAARARGLSVDVVMKAVRVERARRKAEGP